MRPESVVTLGIRRIGHGFAWTAPYRSISQLAADLVTGDACTGYDVGEEEQHDEQQQPD